MTDLVAFLEARVAEDQAAAEEASIRAAEWHRDEHETAWGEDAPEVILAGGKPLITFSVEYGAPCAVDHVLRWDPARVLAEIAAKRLIVAEYVGCREQYEDDPHDETRAADRSTLEMVLCLLAQSYASHPDFDESWRT